MPGARFFIWTGLATCLFLAGVWAFWPRAVEVDLVEISSGPMRVSVSDEGDARVHDVFVVLAPVVGDLARIHLEAGDCVFEGQTPISVISAQVAPVIDARMSAQLRAALASQQAGEADARAELRRVSQLASSGTAPRQKLEQAETLVQVRAAASAFAAANLTRALREVDRAQAALVPAGAAGSEDGVTLTSPVSGLVLRVLRESAGPVVAGEPILELGDPGDLEVVIDLLSEDAVKIRPGDRVQIGGWGGPSLPGRVRRVEPFAFTKVSALGIEEQRVNVRITLLASPGRLGHGYRVRADIETWFSPASVQAPITALFKTDSAWTTYRVKAGRAEQARVEVGHMNGRNAEILSGVEPGDRLIEHPGTRVRDGVRLVARQVRPVEIADPFDTEQPSETETALSTMPCGPGPTTPNQTVQTGEPKIK